MPFVWEIDKGNAGLTHATGKNILCDLSDCWLPSFTDTVWIATVAMRSTPLADQGRGNSQTSTRGLCKPGHDILSAGEKLSPPGFKRIFRRPEIIT